jgi:hypothetical protein
MSNYSGQDLFDRREFTRQLVLAVLSGTTVTVTACGGGGGGSSPAPSPSPTPNPGGDGDGGVTGAISGNHGHVATITDAQLSAANEITLDITGQADHPHTVMLTGDDVMQIAARQRVVKTSTTDVAHLHQVTFN